MSYFANLEHRISLEIKHKSSQVQSNDKKEKTRTHIYYTLKTIRPNNLKTGNTVIIFIGMQKSKRIVIDISFVRGLRVTRIGGHWQL